MIPGLNDRDIPAILRAGREAGATFASIIPVRLHPTVQPVFEARLRERMPGRADAILAKTRRARGGALHEARFGERFAGSGPEWEATLRLFELWRSRLGFGPRPPVAEGTFVVPGAGRQIRLLAVGAGQQADPLAQPAPGGGGGQRPPRGQAVEGLHELALVEIARRAGVGQAWRSRAPGRARPGRGPRRSAPGGRRCGARGPGPGRWRRARRRR